MDQNNNSTSWFHRFVSIDEMRVSVLVVVLLCFVGIDIYSVIAHGEIPQNLANISMMAIGTIGGVNAISFIGGNIMANRTPTNMPMNNMNPYGMNNMYGSSMYNPNGLNNMMPTTMNPIVNQPQQVTQQTTTTTTSLPRPF